MKFLVVGKGAREHALLWKLRSSAVVTDLYFWPGNPALGTLGRALDLSPTADFAALIAAVRAQTIDAVLVGPEAPLAAGLGDALLAAKIPCFGPCQAAAQLESSKAFAKDVMQAAGIPTARSRLAKTRSDCRKLALEFFDRDGGVVLKASGLASGKGVFVCTQRQQIDDGIERLYGTMAAAAETVVIEELMVGKESSYFVLIGNGGVTELGFAVDYKRLQDGDAGPNTGGMGCYTPVPWHPEKSGEKITSLVVAPLLAELANRGIEYCGWLYVGLMWTDAGPRVVEFNVRLGDPEAEVLAVADERDWGALIAWKLGLLPPPRLVPKQAERAAVAVVMASADYPYGVGPKHDVALHQDLFNGEETGVAVFAAAVSGSAAKMMSASGRILTVVGCDESLRAARAAAYAKVRALAKDMPHAQWRQDIGLAVIHKE